MEKRKSGARPVKAVHVPEYTPWYTPPYTPGYTRRTEHGRRNSTAAPWPHWKRTLPPWKLASVRDGAPHLRNDRLIRVPARCISL